MMSVVAPNLGSLPDEVLVQIFARLLHVPSKVRLERVSRKFFRCINEQESWKYNDWLSMREFENSITALRSFLRHTTSINRLVINPQVPSPQLFAVLWEFSHKFAEMQDLRYGILNNCPQNGLALAFLANFSSTLTQLRFIACGELPCGTRNTFLQVLPTLTNLYSLTFVLYKSQTGPGYHDAILDSLQQLKSLRILDFLNCNNLDAQRLASIFNENTRINCLRMRKVKSWASNQMRFALATFCSLLSPPAANSLENIEIEEIQVEWTNILPRLPDFFPNLKRIILKVSEQRNVVEVARALGEFLRAGQDNNKREVPLTLDLEVTCSGTFGEELWGAVDLIEIVKSGTKRTQDMTKWNRKLENGNITIKISVE